MGKNHFDRSQSLARVSSASTETDYILATVPFDWETAPGKSAATEREIAEAPSLPLPPGRRPKDGFFLPISRSVQRHNLLSEDGGINSSPRERRSFNLKFPGSSKKTLFKSSKQRKVRKDADCAEDTGSLFNPLPSHRFGSRITRRVLVESQKSPSCFGQCLPVGKKASSSHIDHHRGRGLDDVEDSDGEEHYATPRSSASSGSPLSQSPRHGQGKMRDSSITGAGKQVQVPSSRFNMASMLIALFLPESDDTNAYDQAEAVDGGHEITKEDGGGDRISESLSSPTAPVSNSRRSEKLQQIRPGSDDFTNKSDDRHTFANCEGKVADAPSVKERQNRELSLQPTGKSRQSSISWKSSDQIREKLVPLAAFLTVNEQEPDGFANKSSEKIHGELNTMRQGSCSSLVRSLPSSHNDRSSSNSTRRSRGQNVVFLNSAANKMVLPTPRSSCGSSDFPVINSCSLDSGQAEVERGRSSSAYATPTAEPPYLRRDSFEERLEQNQFSRPPNSSLPQSPLQDQSKLHISIPKASRTENIKVPSNSPPWLQELKSSSLWPNRAQEIAQGDASNRYRGDEFDEDIEHSSTDSFEYRTPRAGSSTLSMSSPVLRSLSTSPKPAIWVLSEEVLKSSSMFQRKLQQQQSHESPRSSFMLDEETNAVPSPSIAFDQNSVTTTRSPTNAPDEYHVKSPDNGSKGEDLATLSVNAPSETSGSQEMSREVQEESKAGVGSFGKSFPIFLRRRGGAIITGKAIPSDNGSGEDYDNSSTDSFELATPRECLLIQTRHSPVLCKFYISLEPKPWVVSEELLKEKLNKSSSLQCKLQRQLQIMGLQTKSPHGANHFENRSTDSFEHGTRRAVSLTSSLNPPILSKFSISLEPESRLVYEEYEEKSK